MDAPTPSANDTLAELASLGMRAARVVTRLMEIEGQAAELVAGWLPEPGKQTTLDEVIPAGQAADAVETEMKTLVPRVEALGRTLDRLARSVRRTLALQRRVAAGWTGTRSDSRVALLRRQVAQGVAAAIRRNSDGEAAEALFAELDERLHDPALDRELSVAPVEELVERLCQDLGLPPGSGLAGLERIAAHQPPTGSPGERDAPSPDTG